MQCQSRSKTKVQQLQRRTLHGQWKVPYRREIIQRRMPTLKVQQEQPAHQVQPAKTAWNIRKPDPKPPTHTRQSTNRFMALQHYTNNGRIPRHTPSGGPDKSDLTKNSRQYNKSPSKANYESTPNSRTKHSPEETPPLRGMEIQEHTQTNSTSRASTNQQIRDLCRNKTINKLTSSPSHSTSSTHQDSNSDCQITVKDIVATSQLIMTMQQQLMSQMADIQPNKYIHNILKAISQSMHEITAKYESCIGMPKV